jgi:hypothetical protein
MKIRSGQSNKFQFVELLKYTTIGCPLSTRCDILFSVVEKEEPMDYTHDDQNWNRLTYKEKNHQLFLKQKAVLDKFMERGAISKAQHDKSLHDLTEKMGEKEK